MHRVRMALPYYKELGWEPVILASDEKYVEGLIDPLLNETIPPDIEIHKVKAWPVKITRRIWLGSLSLRSYYFFKKKGNELLGTKKFDLVFFSTSMFHLCALGRYWKKKFNVPFIVDMQDPWRNDFYLNKPRSQRPPKFAIAHAINKRMEAYTMPFVDGIMAVSQGYIDDLKSRYPSLKNKFSAVIPFGTSLKDFEIVKQKNILPEIINCTPEKINIVYVGTLTQFFLPLIKAFFIAFSRIVPDKEKYHFYFIGTKYKKLDTTNKPVKLLAEKLNLGHLITEVPERIPYFSALSIIMNSDILFIPGSSDPNYNASKVYHNIQTGNPIFSIYNEKSLVKKAIEDTNSGIVISIRGDDNESDIVEKISVKLKNFERLHHQKTDIKKMKIYSAKAMVQKQVNFFNKVIE